MSSATIINSGVSEESLRGSSIAKKIEFTTMTLIEIVSTRECIIINYAPRLQ